MAAFGRYLMRRAFLSLIVLVAPAVALLTAGCEPEVRTVHRSERIEESEPRTVSPGQEVVE